MNYFPHILFLIICINGCTDPIFFDTSQSQSLLIIDGAITNEPGPHHIVLARSAQFAGVREGGNELRVFGATVTISDDLGNEVTLTEYDTGNYVTPNSFHGEIGRTYILNIETPDDKRYVSTPQKLPPTGNIDNVYHEFVQEEILKEGALIKVNRVRYDVDFTFTQPEQYFRWDWESTYMFPTKCYLEDPGPTCNPALALNMDPNPPRWCYVSDSLPANFVNITSREDFTTASILDHRMASLPYDARFVRRLGFKAIQHSLSKEAYDYWKLVETQVGSNGTIFDPSPVRITGNMVNVNDEEEIVLGFFGAYGVTSRRDYADARFFEIKTPDIICPMQSPIIFASLPSANGNWCHDCRLYLNGKAEKPDFWID